jgi:hypothetical protein
MYGFGASFATLASHRAYYTPSAKPVTLGTPFSSEQTGIQVLSYPPISTMAAQTTKLKSRTGCLTCVARKKKCDEKQPRCGHCERLGLACKSRSTRTPVTLTNIRQKSISPTTPVSSGYPSFVSDEEKRVTMASPEILAAFVSRVADRSFCDLPLIGRLCVQSRLVREAVMAFSVAFYPDPSDSHYKLSLRSYQSCIAGIQSLQALGSRSSKETITLLTAACFLGLLEVRFSAYDPRGRILNIYRVSILVVQPTLWPISICAESFSCIKSTRRRPQRMLE